MNENLTAALYERHAKILTADGRKITPCVEDGWYTLIDELCGQLQRMTDREGAPQVVAQQIKEKLGGLRFYVGTAHVSQHALIRFAEDLSYRICETCGATGQLLATERHWLLTRCPEHAPPGAAPTVPENHFFRMTRCATSPAVQGGEG